MSKPVIFLAFANDKQDFANYLLHLPKELEGVRDALKVNPKGEGKNYILIKETALTSNQLVKTFLDESVTNEIAIFHYGGHSNSFELLLEDYNKGNEKAHGKGLIDFFSNAKKSFQKNLHLVFLNGCSNDTLANELSNFIPVVIGTTFEVNDKLASEFAAYFYYALANGHTIRVAFDAAKSKQDMQLGDTLRGNYHKGLDHEPTAEPWQLYYQDEKELEWKLEKKQEQILNQNLVKKLIDKLQFLPDVQKFLNEETANWDKDSFTIKKAKNVLIKVFGSLVGQVLGKLFITDITPQDYQRNAIICYKTILQLLCFSYISYLYDKKEHHLFDFKVFFNAQKSMNLEQWKNLFQSTLKVVKEKPYLNPFKVEEFEIGLFLEKDGFFEQNALKMEALSQKNEVDIFQVEEVLGNLLHCFAFLTRYNMISVRKVELHQFKNISQNYIKIMQVLKMGENSQNTILKYNARPIDSLSVLLQGTETLINLSPFILDFNTFENNDVALIGFYEWRNESEMNYFLLEKDDFRKMTFEDKISKIEKEEIKKEDEMSIKLEMMMLNFVVLLNSFLNDNFLNDKDTFRFKAKIAERKDNFDNL